MYKIDFEIKTILPWETPHSVMTNLNVKEIYKKLHLATSSDVINGYLKLTLVRADELSIALTGFAYCMDISDFTKVQLKLRQTLYEELKGIDKNIQIEVRYCKVKPLNFTHSLFVFLKVKIQSMFRRLKQRFLTNKKGELI